MLLQRDLRLARRLDVPITMLGFLVPEAEFHEISQHADRTLELLREFDAVLVDQPGGSVILWLFDVDRQKAAEALERLKQALGDAAPAFLDRPFGAVEFPENGLTFDALVARLDVIRRDSIATFSERSEIVVDLDGHWMSVESDQGVGR